MSVLHSNTTPPIGQTAWEAAHTVEAGSITAAMLDAAYQPLDSDLTAIAALTTTSYGRAFLALANAAAARTALALGTAAVAATGDFDATGAAAAAQSASQPLDSDLTAIAALTTTSYGRAFLALADAAAARTALSLGTLATQSGTFSGTSSGTNTGDQTLSDATISTTDITTNNVSTSKHGFAPKAPNVATQYLDGTGAYSTPAGTNPTSPLQGATVSGDQGGKVTFADGAGSGTGGAAKLEGGYASGHSDRQGGYFVAKGGTGSFGGVELGVGDSFGGATTRPRMVWSGPGGNLQFLHPGAVSFENDEGDLTFSLLPYGGSTLVLNMPRLPTSDPHVVGRIWNNSGVMTVSNG